jgi:hypothetical protein
MNARVAGAAADDDEVKFGDDVTRSKLMSA